MSSESFTADFEKLFESYYSWIRSIAFRMVGPNDFQDLAQTAFMKAWQSRHGFQAKSQAKTWIYRIAVNCIIDHLRKRQNENALRDTKDVESVGLVPADTDRPNVFLPQAMDQLEVNDRLILALHYFEDLSLKEIAVILKTPEGTVKSRLFVARQKLRSVMTDDLGKMTYERS